MKRWGIGLTIAGGLICVLAVVGAVIAGFVGFGGAVPEDSQITRVSGTTTVTAVGDDAMYLYVPETAPAADCVITDPTGAPVTGASTFSSSFTYEGQLYESFLRFGGAEAPDGDFTITCVGSDVIAAPAVSAGAITGGVLGILLGVFGGIGGFLVLVLGIILWIVGARRANRPQTPGAWGPGPGGSPGT